MSDEVRRIPLDRRVCVVRQNRIDLRPERGALVWPLIGLAIGLALFAAVALFANDLSATALALMLIPGVIIAPFSAMGLIYSVIGAAVVIEAKKQSVRFQQGVLGLGLGTVELVPFWKIERIEVSDFPLGDAPSHLPRPAFDLRAWDILLVKTSGKRLSIAQVVSANQDELIDEGFNRALDAAEAIGFGVVSFLHIFNPSIVVIGGGVTNLGDRLFAPIRDVVSRRVMDRRFVVPIVLAELKENVGLLGALALALDPPTQKEADRLSDVRPDSERQDATAQK